MTVPDLQVDIPLDDRLYRNLKNRQFHIEGSGSREGSTSPLGQGRFFENRSARS